MAVVKATFTKSRAGAKASLRYILFRPGRDGEKIQRHLFGHDGTLSLYQGNKLIEEAGKGTVFFRIVISPDPSKEDVYKDLNLWELTQLTILKLEERLKQEIQFVATEHNDHTPNRHIHAIALVQGRLNIEDLTSLRHSATELALTQRQERDLALAYQQGRGPVPVPVPPVPVRPNARTPEPQRLFYVAPRRRGLASSRPARPVYQVCHLCGKPAGRNTVKCLNCGARLAISLDLGDNGLEDDWNL